MEKKISKQKTKKMSDSRTKVVLKKIEKSFGDATKLMNLGDLKDVPLGTRMRDKITGFEGIAVAKIVFLNKCVQYQLKPSKLDKDGKVYSGETFDIQQLEIIDDGILEKKKEEKESTGGIMPDSPKLETKII